MANSEEKQKLMSEKIQQNENIELEKGEENTEEQQTPRKPSDIIFIPAKANETNSIRQPEETVDIPAKR